MYDKKVKVDKNELITWNNNNNQKIMMKIHLVGENKESRIINHRKEKNSNNKTYGNMIICVKD
ncbi:hypothetical protein RhiirC2_802085 [Rhizophagus irregularis]|uniref:Uncharacterized protein n=1 Tax=Rhizophagus irregularis TaxID=588596 RepID=A0A2N1M1N4_9GLOM|nr:hypothetical protein RhiirC2_802085 [Rhizophagus irregularis]